MNTECIICTEWIWTIPSKEIYVTRCGHLFHQPCLTRWIAESQTCPQCRNALTSNGMFRLYTNVSSSSDDEESSLLQSCLDTAQMLLNQQKDLCKKREEKLRALNTNLKNNEDIVKSYNQKLQQLAQKNEKISKEKKENEEFLKKKIESLNGQVNKARNELVCQEKAVRSLLETKKTQNKAMDKLKEENESLKIIVQTLKGDLDTVLEKLTRRESTLAALKVKQLDQVNIQGDEENEKDKLKKKIKTLKKEIATLERLLTKKTSPAVRTWRHFHTQKRRTSGRDPAAKANCSDSDASECDSNSDNQSEVVDRPSDEPEELNEPLKNENEPSELNEETVRDETAATANTSVPAENTESAESSRPSGDSVDTGRLYTPRIPIMFQMPDWQTMIGMPPRTPDWNITFYPQEPNYGFRQGF